VTSAALIVVVVAGSFAFADIVLIKALGIGMALAVALDATVVRALLVPATMRLLGHWNWWLPARLRRLPVVGAVVLLLATPLLAACTAGPILANAPAAHPVAVAATPAPSRAADPLPVELPRDDAPHDRLTEWWYYTGHLHAADGRHFGFEFVIFRAERGGFPVTWASHLAVTDETGDAFHYAQRTAFGPQVDLGAKGSGGFDLAITDAAGGAPWSMAGVGGKDRLVAVLAPDEAATAGSADGLGLALALSATKPAALHDNDGWIDFGAGGSSYYYSRTAMTASGSVTIDGADVPVTGSAWFDHQWGDFIAVGGGGWDWFAVNLDDGTDLTLSLVRDADGSYPLVYGTLVKPDGTSRHLPREAFAVEVTKRWTSPASGADYPAGWRISLPGEDLEIELAPTVAAQELDTRPTTGVVYWEGSQRVTARRGDTQLSGEAYVELTGYGPAGTGQP
jgi:predicted secreted hydrolase